MPRVHPIFSNFTRGEISPRLYGRVDWEKYQTGCVTLENFIILQQGGVTRRAGTRFVKEVKNSANAVRLLPFRYSDTDHYVIEMGPLYFRFYKNGARLENGGSPVEVVHAYTADDLWDVHYKQMGNVMILTSQAGTYKLARFSDTVWRVSAFTPDPPPTVEYGTRPSTYLVPAATSGTNVQFDAGAAIFLDADVGREIIAEGKGGRATIVTIDSTSRVHADIEDTFTDTDQIAAANWYIAQSPQTTCTASATGPVNADITLTLGANGFSSSDVDKYVIMDGGVAQITAYSTGTSVTAQVLREFEGTTAQPAGAWSLEEAAWSAENGYPSTVDFFEGRMLFGGSTYQKDTIWASASLDYYDFALGSTDDASINVRSGSGEYGAIRWFSPRRTLLMGTSDGEYSLTGGNDAAITPSNIRIRPATPHGSSLVMPVRAEHATLFLTENGRILRELAYAYEVDDYRAPDLLAVSEHLTQTATIVDMAYQKPPDSIVWCVRSDGTLLGLTYMRDQDVVGWHRHVTDGLVESVAVIQSATGLTEQPWLLVNRTIGGQTKRYIEYMDAETTLHSAVARGLRTDCCVVYDSTPTTTVTGLTHLEGETMQIVGDGAVYPEATVTSGAVTLAGIAASKIEVGLGYTATLQTVRPEVPLSGTSQGLAKSWANVRVRLMNTMGCKINNEILPWRSSDDTMDEPPPMFSGDKKVTQLGWDTDAWVTISQVQPLPITVLAITGVLVVNDG